MSVRIQTVPDHYYHVYNRGVDKRKIFDETHDYQRFLLLLLLSNDSLAVDVGQSIRDNSIVELIHKSRTPLVYIHAFSLLPNHYHLLVSPAVDSGVSKFIQKVGTGYTMYFNRKNERSGALFQGKYKIKYLEDDRYIKYLFDYIHLNPIREEFDKINSHDVNSLVESLERNPWTSLSAYSGVEAGGLSDSVLDKSLFQDVYTSYKEYRRALCSWKEESFQSIE